METISITVTYSKTRCFIFLTCIVLFFSLPIHTAENFDFVSRRVEVSFIYDSQVSNAEGIDLFRPHFNFQGICYSGQGFFHRL